LRLSHSRLLFIKKVPGKGSAVAKWHGATDKEVCFDKQLLSFLVFIILPEKGAEYGNLNLKRLWVLIPLAQIGFRA